MDTGWFGLVLSKSYPTATPMQCSLENLGISWISKHQTYGWKHVSNLRYTEFLAAVPWNATRGNVAVKNHPLVKLIYCKCKWSYFWRDLFFHFHERKNERSGFILLLIGYDGIPLDLHFFFWPLVHSDCLVFCHPIDVFSFSLWLFLALLFFPPIIKT